MFLAFSGLRHFLQLMRLYRFSFKGTLALYEGVMRAIASPAYLVGPQLLLLDKFVKCGAGSAKRVHAFVHGVREVGGRVGHL